MNRKKYGIILGAVAIALIMVSSATAVTMPQSNENSSSGPGVTNCVEPGIHINVIQKRILRAALKDVDDPGLRTLLEEIIKKKGPVDSSDIEKILSDHPDIEVGTITSGSIETGDHCSGGWMNSLRRPLCLCLIVGPFACLHFRACYQDAGGIVPTLYPQITIGGKFIDYDIEGNAIGIRVAFPSGNFIPTGFVINGVAVLINYRPM